MAEMLWSQDFFAKGELTPLMYSRVTLQTYYQALKTANNTLCYPQGALGKRFGTRTVQELTLVNAADEAYLESFPYLNECTYVVAFKNNEIDIFLEDDLIAHVSGTGITAEQIQLIDHTILEDRFRITTGIYPPKDLLRSADTANPITGFTASTLTVTNALIEDRYFPVRLNGTALPTTTPQIYENITYFARVSGSTTTIKLYENASNAATDTNAFTIGSAGTAANLLVLNQWALSNVTFENYPSFDFSGGYNSSAFTPSATTGYGVVITRTSGSFNFESRYVNGRFTGNGGDCKIIAVNGTNQATVDVIRPFESTAAIPGTQTFIAEPAWSDTRGWPRKCSSFQNRAFFANTDSLSNGLWGSSVNIFDDFDEILGEDDKAISWFPTSDTVNYIHFIVPYRSLTIHTNSGVYSTPISVDSVIKQSNFTLTLQDQAAAQTVQPTGLDNQILSLSGDDLYSLLWDGINNSYQSDLVSIANEHLISNPVDQASYINIEQAGSRYVIIVNEDGTLAIYQTLITQNISGMTPGVAEQSHGNAYFRQVTSSPNGRAWFLTEREIAVQGTPYAITAYTADTLTNATYNYPTDTFTAVIFAGTTLPTSSPQIIADKYYWAVGVSGSEFKVYTTQDDATNSENAITFSDAGTSATATAAPLTTKFWIEELDFNAQMDATAYYPNVAASGATSTISGYTIYESQDILIQGDGFRFDDNVSGGTIDIQAHGEAVEITEAQFGFPISVQMQPLPISMSVTGNPKASILVEPKNIRSTTFMFANTIGGSINQAGTVIPITMQTLEETIPGNPPSATTGRMKISIMNGFDDFTIPSFTINHTEPFGIQLTGLFYTLDV